jgi:PAS domain S-box-containing protein
VNTTIDCSELVAASGDAIIASDGQGHIVLWNAAAQRIFGHSEAQALGRPLDMIIPERLRKRHGEGYEKSMRTGETRYGSSLLRVPALHKDGRTLSIAFSVAMLFSADRKVSAIVAIIRDETDRFNEERELRKRLAELEARLAAAPPQAA